MMMSCVVDFDLTCLLFCAVATDKFAFLISIYLFRAASARVQARRPDLQQMLTSPTSPCDRGPGGGTAEDKSEALLLNPLAHLPV